MKSSHSKSTSSNLASHKRTIDVISNELIQECKTCKEEDRISKNLRLKLERLVIFDYFGISIFNNMLESL